MTKTQIIKQVINKSFNDDDWYSPSEGILCNDFWCYKYKDEVIKLSDIKPKKRKLFWTKEQNKIRESIKETGFDYTKGYIILTKDGDIVDGYHRYISLVEHYNPDSTISLKRLENLYSGELSVTLYFYFLVILPLKTINLLITKLNPF